MQLLNPVTYRQKIHTIKETFAHDKMHTFNVLFTDSLENVKKVNYSLTQKVAETVALEQRLTTAECENRAVSNKLYRHNELTKASKVIRKKLRKIDYHE